MSEDAISQQAQPKPATSQPAKPRSMRWVVLSVVVVVVLVGGYQGVMHLIRQHVTGLIKASEQKPLPDFRLQDRNGKAWTREAVLGKTVVLNFFRSQCSNCTKESPVIRKLAAEVDRDKVLVLGIMVDAVMGFSEEVTAATLRRYDYRHPVLMADAAFVDAFHTVGWTRVTPVTYVASPKGVIVKALRGHQDLETLLAAIR